MTRRRTKAGLDQAEFSTEARAMERLDLIDKMLDEAYANALPHLTVFENSHRELVEIVSRARQADLDWKGWVFCSLGYHPRESGFFAASLASEILDCLDEAAWALRRRHTEKWKWFGMGLHGAMYGLMQLVLRQNGAEPGRGPEGEKAALSFVQALETMEALVQEPSPRPGREAPLSLVQGQPSRFALPGKALRELDGFYQQRFQHIRPGPARPFRITEFLEQVAVKVLCCLASLALEHYDKWTTGQRLRLMASLAGLADLLLLEYGLLQGELMQMLCRAHFSGLPLARLGRR